MKTYQGILLILSVIGIPYLFVWCLIESIRVDDGTSWTKNPLDIN